VKIQDRHLVPSLHASRMHNNCLCFYLCDVKGKVTVVLVLFLNWAPCHKGILGERKYSATHSLTSALDGSEWSASHPGHFTPRERAPGTYWIGGWVGPRAVWDMVVKRKIPSPHQESNLRTLIVQPIAQRYINWAATALFMWCLNLIMLVQMSQNQKPELKVHILSGNMDGSGSAKQKQITVIKLLKYLCFEMSAQCYKCK
jgi:hypothetical protein